MLLKDTNICYRYNYSLSHKKSQSSGSPWWYFFESFFFSALQPFLRTVVTTPCRCKPRLPVSLVWRSSVRATSASTYFLTCVPILFKKFYSWCLKYITATSKSRLIPPSFMNSSPENHVFRYVSDNKTENLFAVFEP